MSLEQGRELDPSQNQNTLTASCPDCGSGLLQADEFEKIGDEMWFVLIECAECDWSKTKAINGEEIDEIDEILDGNDRVLKEKLSEMERATPEELIGAFAAAGHKPN